MAMRAPVQMVGCVKNGYRTRVQACRAASSHRRAMPGCRRCRAGWEMRGYRCLDDGEHWHIGHTRPQRVQRLLRQALAR